ncbi:EamA family transporter RarD [Petrocella sp. FN5]|uniref:EamA family transporter RarD n=1 Tax=Petrocella sp. FN5 TaxID=3032002 RepID=UPI0023DCB1F5|nr:EamA family transporter RarD [Petrocella sp. FN5]MDF1618342.1 EamA family transporter RarD [Petrocella sp. FN5]
MESKLDIRGYALVFSSYVMWGLLTFYWKQLTMLLPFEVLSTRIIFSFVTMGLVLMWKKNRLFISYLTQPNKRKILILTSILIMANWVIYIYAVSSDQIVQASLGYYINPLVSILLGLLLLKERITRLQMIAVGFALAGVLYMTFGYGRFPWISIAVAMSFGFYGYTKKKESLDTLNSLFVEMMMGLPFALVYITWLNSNGGSHFLTVSAWVTFLMCLSGVVSIVPLLCFTEGAKRIPLSSVGFLQYIAPTLMLLIGVLVYDEPFTSEQLFSFILIWIGLSLYTFSLIRTKPRMIIKTNEEVDGQNDKQWWLKSF